MTEWAEFRGDLHAVSEQGDLLTIRTSPGLHWCRVWDRFLGAVPTLEEARRLCAGGRPLDVARQEKDMRKTTLRWRPTRKGRTEATEIPDGETFQVYVQETSKNSAGRTRFYAHRNGRVLGVTDTLEEAKALCAAGVPRPQDAESRRRVQIYVEQHAEDAEKFFALSEAEQRWIKWLHPRAAPKEATYGRVRLDPTTGEYRAGGTLEFRPVGRGKREKRPREPRPERAAKAPPADLDAVIHRLRQGNPHREGSAPHRRWEYLFEHDGRTVRAYAENRGNMTTLENAIKRGYVEVRK